MLTLCFTLAGCMSAAKHQSELASNNDRFLTLGLVQKEIKQGMPQADVAVALGSPNIVTGSLNGQEVWIYDKVATETSFSSDGGGIGSSITGSGNFPGQTARDASGDVTGSVTGSYTKSAGAASVSQRTLTVVIRFTPEKAVDSVSYNSTRF